MQMRNEKKDIWVLLIVILLALSLDESVKNKNFSYYS